MIDDNLKVYLIECNTNPCLELCCPLLARIIPNMIDNALKFRFYIGLLLIQYIHLPNLINGNLIKKNLFKTIKKIKIDLN